VTATARFGLEREGIVLAATTALVLLAAYRPIARRLDRNHRKTASVRSTLVAEPDDGLDARIEPEVVSRTSGHPMPINSRVEGPSTTPLTRRPPLPGVRLFRLKLPPPKETALEPH
jgi:hypothetical protein